MCAAPYTHEFDDSYAVVSSNSGGELEATTSIHSIILDNGEKGCKNFRVNEWSHLIVSLLTNCGYLAFAGFLMYKYRSDSDHYVFSTLILIKFVFANYFLFHGIFREQPFQIVMQGLTTLSLWSLDLIYYIMDIASPPVNSDVSQIGIELMLFYFRSSLALLSLLTGSVIAWKYWTIEQAIFKTVGTDMRRVLVFRNLFFGFSIMVFDMETSLVSLILFLRNGFTSIVVHEIVVLTAGSVFLLLWVILGYKAMRSESRALTWTFYLVSFIQPAYIIILFIRNIKYTGSSEPVLTATSHMMAFVTLTVHLTVMAAVIVASHYYGRGYGDALDHGIHVSVKNSAEYEDLRRILFHPITPSRSSFSHQGTSQSRTILLNAEVY